MKYGQGCGNKMFATTPGNRSEDPVWLTGDARECMEPLRLVVAFSSDHKWELVDEGVVEEWLKRLSAGNGAVLLHQWVGHSFLILMTQMLQ